MNFTITIINGQNMHFPVNMLMGDTLSLTVVNPYTSPFNVQSYTDITAGGTYSNLSSFASGTNIYTFTPAQIGNYIAFYKIAPASHFTETIDLSIAVLPSNMPAVCLANLQDVGYWELYSEPSGITAIVGQNADPPSILGYNWQFGITNSDVSVPYYPIGTPLMPTYEILGNGVNGYVTSCTPSPPPPGPPPPPPPGGNCYLLTVGASAMRLNVPNTSGLPFVAYLSNNYGIPYQVNATGWYVNDILGGNAANGFITQNGIYTFPNGYAPINQNVKISATYTANTTPLSAWTSLSIIQSLITSSVCQISCDGQVNIFLGDGRHCFIPAGTQFTLLPGQYWVAQYQETMDANMLPINSGNSQDLTTSMFAISGLSNTLSYTIYNENTIIPNTTTGGSYTRNYSIVLGMCDPVDGRFQSMWPMFKSVAQVSNYIPPSPAICMPGS